MLDRRFIFRVMFYLILIVPVSVDLINGLIFFLSGSEVSIGALYRVALMGMTLPFIFLIKNAFVKFWVGGMIFFFFVSFTVWNFHADFIELKTEVEFLSRIMLPYFLLAFFIYVQENYVVDFDQVLSLMNWFGFIIGGCIVFSFITGVGIKTYDDYSYGVKSFFIAVNDIGLCLLLCFTASMYRFLANFTLFKAIQAITCFMGLLATGSRTGTAGASAVLFFFLIVPLFYGRKNVNMAASFKIGMISVMMIGAGVMIKVAYDYIQEYPYMMENSSRWVKKVPVLTWKKPQWKGLTTDLSSCRSLVKELMLFISTLRSEILEVKPMQKENGWSRTSWI
ncbi:MAG: O-antigen ligase family protein [Flavobacteriales bacterium]|nr:O-antigen ligase family protein [Flavobacteriales bacterium]